MTKSFFCFKRFFLLWIGLGLCVFSQSVLSAEIIGQMVWVKGQVQAIDASQHARTLQRRSPIYVQDTIVTGSGSGQIVFTDNSLLALRQGTTFQITQYHFIPPPPNNNKYVGRLIAGGFRTITGFIPKSNPDSYQMETPVATIGVRGTEYSTDCTSGRCVIHLQKGVVTVSNAAGKAQLDAARNLVYAEIAGLNAKPVVTSTPPPGFKDQEPDLVPSTMRSSSSTPSKTLSSHEHVPAGSTKKVDEFCIN